MKTFYPLLLMIKGVPSYKAFLLSFKEILKSLGPGLITGAADEDPSTIGTYSQAGAQFGLGMLWLAVLLPYMVDILAS
ncbi:MAG: hypothetical protein WAM14_09515 [Candidatus Nitrosopolaris sp.]